MLVVVSITSKRTRDCVRRNTFARE